MKTKKREGDNQVDQDFQDTLQQPRICAERIAGYLRKLGILHKAIDAERAGMLALVESADGTHLGDLIDLGGKSSEELLRDVRNTLATVVARQALGIKDHGHFNHISELITYGAAGWMAEIYFDYDDSRYALVGEYIIPTDQAPLGWTRDYRLYQAKADSLCDVPGCGARWYERKMTRHGYCVHVCRQHQTEDADKLYMRLHKAQDRGGAE